MKKIMSVLLVTLCIFSLCGTAFAVPANSEEEPAPFFTNDELQDINISEFNNHETEIYSSSNGSIRVCSISQNAASLEEYSDFDDARFSQRGTGMITDALDKAGDIAPYTLTIDHSVTPKVLVCAYPFATTKDFAIQIYGEDSREIWNSKVEVNKNYYEPKKFYPITGADGQTEVYTIIFTALEDNTGFGFTVGTEETFAEDFGALQTCPTIPKNIPYGELEQIGSTRYINGFRSLLNSGESFLYVADGETFITAGGDVGTDIDFIVRDLDTDEVVCETTSSDHLIWYTSSTMREDDVAKCLKLKYGHTYLITFYSSTYQPIDSVWDTYTIWIGMPCFRSQSISCASSSVNLPANTKRTYTFNLSGFPKSARVSTNTTFNVKGSDSFGYITYCQITAPNGYTFLAPHGHKSEVAKPEIYNYLETPNNIPINGNWKVTVMSSHAIPDLKFSISGSYRMIVGNDVN